jgi:hypothetical protein
LPAEHRASPCNSYVKQEMGVPSEKMSKKYTYVSGSKTIRSSWAAVEV